jgi:hypothetical protein
LNLRAGALVTGLALATVPILGSADWRERLAAVAVVGLVLLVLGLSGEWSDAIGWSAGALGAEYVLALMIGGVNLDARAPLVGAGLFLMSELAYWSIERRAPIRDDPAVHRGRGRAIVAPMAGGAALGVVPLAAAQVAVGASLPLTILAAFAALGLLGLLLRGGWRTGSRSGEADDAGN